MNHIRQHLIFLLTLAILLTLIGFVVVADAQQFIVRVIYFQPTDAPAPTDRIAELMIEVQDFYQSEMERHGYGGKTFKLETRSDGVPVIHTVEGIRTASYYQAQTWDRIIPELPSQFQNENRIHVIIIGNTQLINNSFCGLGWDFVGTGISQGFLLVPSADQCLTVSVIVHELGHTFGLRHNHDGSTFLMGVGNDDLSECETAWLDKHHYFNETQRLNAAPVLINTYPLETALDDLLGLKIDVSDDSGLHHAYFLFKTILK